MHGKIEGHVEHHEGMSTLPGRFLLLVGLILLWIYGYRILTRPLTWEEPRRCLVALEMIHRGDYIVPYVLGEPYRNKPPLQNWLIILLAGNHADRVGPLVIRSISILSLLGIVCFLWRLSLSWKNLFSPWSPALIFLTMGIVVQYGRSGELDPLFTFWITASFFCFEMGRRKRSAWLQWFLPQALLAGGILTKVLAPLFFYPPVLFCTWKDREKIPFSAKAFALGLVTEMLLVSAWLIPYSFRGSAASLGKRWTEEMLQRTPLWNGAEAFLKHLILFPLEILGTMLPWSIACALWLVPNVRRHFLTLLRMDPFLRLTSAIALWSIGLLWIMTGAKGRYLFPSLPFLAVLIAHTIESPLALIRGIKGFTPERLIGMARSAFVERGMGWVMASLLWGIGFVLAGVITRRMALWQPMVCGMAVIGWIGFVVHRDRKPRPFPMLLLIALLYGILYAGVIGSRKTEREQRSVESAQRIAASIQESLPVVCDKNVPYRDCYAIISKLDRLAQRIHPTQGPYFLVTSLSSGLQVFGPAVVEAPPLGLWRINRE